MFFPVLFFVSLLFCFLLTFVLVPVFHVLAESLGMVDRPGLARRVHSTPTPRTGGLAIFPSFLATSFLFCHADAFLITLWCGAAAMLLLGALDDAYGLPAFPKLAVQLLVSWLTVRILLPAGDYSPWVRLAAFLWVPAVTNAHNMIDGLDGLCGGISAVEALVTCAWLLVAGAPSNARAALFLAIALSAFLVYNRHPAKIFLGDAGALSIGYVLSLLTLRGGLLAFSSSASVMLGIGAAGTATPALLRLLVPALVCAVPLTDLTFSVIRRLWQGRSPLAADRGHLHHLLIDAGCTVRTAVRRLVFLSGALAATGLLLLAPVGCAPALLPLLCAIKQTVGDPVGKSPRFSARPSVDRPERDPSLS